MHIPMNRVKQNGMVEFWDLGPQIAPKGPDAPIEPKESKDLKGADLAAATVEYEDACEHYKDELRRYTAAKKAYRDWHAENGGPVKLERYGVTAREAFEREPHRYKLDLPRGQKPGRAQIENEERAVIEADELKRARSLDPQFGAGAQAP